MHCFIDIKYLAVICGQLIDFMILGYKKLAKLGLKLQVSLKANGRRFR